MTRLLLCSSLFSFSCFLFCLASCQKDGPTIVKGTIIDKVTGEPLDSVRIEYKIYYDESGPIEYIETDKNGKFEFRPVRRVSIVSAYKIGYLLSGSGLDNGIPKINSGETNDIIVKLTPRDGILKASNQRINLYWGLSPLPYTLKNLPIQGAVDIIRNDTASFTISF
ncbi:MAG: hypothetical protein IPH31_11255 [Lewinellaceae bacterium]|nr:hypothetical protein [Lewinellaceae bacterium]